MGIDVPDAVLLHARSAEHLGVLVRVLAVMQRGLDWGSWSELGRLSGVDRQRARRACLYLRSLGLDWSDRTAREHYPNSRTPISSASYSTPRTVANTTRTDELIPSRAPARIDPTISLSLFSTPESADSEHPDRTNFFATGQGDPQEPLTTESAAESVQSQPALIEPPLIPPSGVSVPPLLAAPSVARVPSEREPSPADDLLEYLRGTWTAQQLGKAETLGAWVDSQIAANPGVDLLQEAKRARGWELSNPRKAKKRVRRYLSNWWNRCRPQKQSDAREAIEAALGDLDI